MTGGPETNVFILADRLRKTPGEIRAMPNRDFVGLVNYFTVKNVLTELNERTEANRAGLQKG